MYSLQWTYRGYTHYLEVRDGDAAYDLSRELAEAGRSNVRLYGPVNVEDIPGIRERFSRAFGFDAWEEAIRLRLENRKLAAKVKAVEDFIERAESRKK